MLSRTFGPRDSELRVLDATRKRPIIRTVLGLSGELDFERAVADVESVRKDVFHRAPDLRSILCGVLLHYQVCFQCTVGLVQLPDMHVVDVADSGHIDQRG